MAQIMIRQGLYKQDAENNTVLIGSYCPDCGESFFPARRLCAKCSGRNLQDTELAREGEIVTYTVVRQGPATWKGPMPYIIVQVKLDDGPIVQTQLAEPAESKIVIGSRVELILEKLKEDNEGNEIMAHMFRLKERR